MSDSIWLVEGTDKNYQHYRSAEWCEELRGWVDDVYYNKGLNVVLDKNFIEQFRNHDFFARLWELELADWLRIADLKLLPTNGRGPDFCVELSDGRKVWIEAVLVTPDLEMDKVWRANLAKPGELAELYDFPKDANALRYASSLFTKAVKIKEKYLDMVDNNDLMLIAVSAFPPSALHSDMEHFLRAVMPMGDPVVHISTNGQPLDPSVPRSTHTDKSEYVKENGSAVLKQFLYPGTHFPHIDGVVFTEASNLQQLLGSVSSRFGDETNIPHIFPNYASHKELPAEFTDNFYLHEFIEGQPLVSLRQSDPKRKLM